MSLIIQPNYGLEKLVQNPHFEKENPFDYSIGRDNAVDVYLRTGKPQSIKPLFRDGTRTKITAADIVRLDDYDPQKYQLLLVPVGFTFIEAREVLCEIAVQMKKVFQKVPAQFSYLPKSVPIPIDHIKHLAYIAEKESRPILRRLRNITPMDGVAAVLNTNECFGGYSGEEVVFSGRNYYTLHFACHELGHLFGLDDGYEIYYDDVNGTELLTAFNALPKNIRSAVKKFNVPIYKTGNHYNGQAVYRFYQHSIMACDYNAYFQGDNWETENPVFTDFQIHIMQRYIYKKPPFFSLEAGSRGSL